MAFTLNAGEFDLGAGFIGRGTILAGEAYSVGTATTGVQGLLNTSGIEGLSYSANFTGVVVCSVVAFRESIDTLNGTIGSSDWGPFVQPIGSLTSSGLTDNARFFLAAITNRNDEVEARWAYLNTSMSSTKVLAAMNATTQEELSEVLMSSSNWRFLSRDHATAITHYPSTAIQGSVFAAACVNSATQWGLWAAGAVGNRSGYFSQRQGDFAIVLLQNGANTYL